MKDTVIKETGNSRFLRSSVSEDITFSEFIALLRAGKLPIDLAGINEEGIDVLGTALNKANLLRDETEAFVFGNAADRTLDETFLRLAPWTLIDTLDGSTGYSGEWVAPDIFGDGSAYDLGVYMIGGGQSGQAKAILYKLSYDDGYIYYAHGGASGYGRNTSFDRVSPGTSFAFVIGKGGAAAKATRSNNDGMTQTGASAGGTTSFGGVTTPGGGSIVESHGGQPRYPSHSGTTEFYFGCTTGDNKESYGYVTPAQNPRLGQNAFDPSMISLARGMNTYGGVTRNDEGTNTTYKQTETGYWGNPTIGTLGAAKAAAAFSTSNVTATATAGTHGNGGGGAIAAQGGSESVTVTATSGAGGDGVIFIYARKAVS